MIAKSAAQELRAYLERTSVFGAHKGKVEYLLWQAVGRRNTKRRGSAAFSHPEGSFHSRNFRPPNALVAGLCNQPIPPPVFSTKKLKVAVDVDEGGGWYWAYSSSVWISEEVGSVDVWLWLQFWEGFWWHWMATAWRSITWSFGWRTTGFMNLQRCGWVDGDRHNWTEGSAECELVHWTDMGMHRRLVQSYCPWIFQVSTFSPRNSCHARYWSVLLTIDHCQLLINFLLKDMRMCEILPG